MYNEMLRRLQERERKSINQEILATLIAGTMVVGSLLGVIWLLMAL